MSSIPLDRLLKLTNDGISLIVRVTPKSHRDIVNGIVELPHDRIGLTIHVSPPAADGAANGAVINLLADLFGVPRNCVAIKSGATCRMKTIYIKGDPLALRARIAKRI